MSFDPVYTRLRNFTSPVAAITSSANGRRGGCIVNSAQRASLVPTIPRLSMYISKINETHDLIYKSGVFALHMLRQNQFDTIFTLGFQSLREVSNKVDLLPTTRGVTGCPLLTDCIAGFECKVVNAMDTGASTFFLGDVVNVIEGKEGPLMTSDFFRDHLSAERKWQYENNLRSAAQRLEELTRKVNRESIWPGPTAKP